MNSFLKTLVLALVLLHLSLPYSFADDDEDDDDDDDDLEFVGVRTYLLSRVPVRAGLLRRIDAGMDSITDGDGERRRQLVEGGDVVEADTQEDVHEVRSLRANGESQRELRCSYCRGYPRYYKGCWVKYTWTPRCRVARRQLIVPAVVDEDAMAKLNDKEQRRYLQLSAECRSAIVTMEAAIANATTFGVVPRLPRTASFVEECIYEEDD